MRTLLAAVLLAAAVLAGAPPALAAAPPALAQARACPTSRAFLEPQLKTLPSDGEYYAVQREAIRMPIAEILKRMGGPERAHAIARATRAHARDKIAAGAEGAARRHWEDTILRADALIAILRCMGQLGDPA